MYPQPAHRRYGGSGGDQWRFKENSRVRVASKLDVSQVRRIVREKARGGMTSGEIAGAVHASGRTVQHLWARFRHAWPRDIECPARMGRPQDGLPGRTEHVAAVACTLGARRGHPCSRGASRGVPACAYRATKYTASKGQRTGRNAAEKVEEAQVDAAGMYHTNMMWHTDFKQLEDGRRFLGCEDDASRR